MNNRYDSIGSLRVFPQPDLREMTHLFKPPVIINGKLSYFRFSPSDDKSSLFASIMRLVEIYFIRRIDGEAPVIISTPHDALDYIRANELTYGENVGIDDLVARNPYTALEYAIYTKARFKKGEKAIGSIANTALIYSIKVLRGRFVAAERTITKNKSATEMYESLILNANISKSDQN